MDNNELIRAAFAARAYAYAPYSHFKVGAALLGTSGKIYTGCNVESAAYTPTCCAERTALVKAISEGERGFVAIAVTGAREDVQEKAPLTSPCGVCRQMLYEFGGKDLRVLMAQTQDDVVEMSLGELLPLGFGPENFL